MSKRKFVNAMSMISEQQNPRIQLLLSGAFLELMLNVLIEDQCRLPFRRYENLPLRTKLGLVYELYDTFEKPDYDRLIWFIDKRNEAAHEMHFSFSVNDIPDQWKHTAVIDISTYCLVTLVLVYALNDKLIQDMVDLKIDETPEG